MEWKDQYKHPNWQKKRLEALDAAEFVCQQCYSDEDQLHVHHKRYIKGRKMWDYSLDELEVLCDSCHEEAHASIEVLNSLLAKIPADGLSEIISLLCGYCSFVSGPCCVDVSGPVIYVGERNNSFASGGIAALFLSIKDREKKQEVYDHVLSILKAQKP